MGTEAPAPIRTFLIADVRGYTRFTEQHGDELAARLTAKFADLVREGVETRGGHVVEIRGDEALAVFESARQAIRAGVDLQHIFDEETEADPDFPLHVGIGIDSGEAVGLEEGGFRGAALNIAARLCALAHGGEIIVSEGTTHLAGRLQGLRYIDRGRMHLKGVTEPVRAMHVAREGEEPSSSSRVFMFFGGQNRMGWKFGAVVVAVAAITAGLVVYLVGENNPSGSAASPPPPAAGTSPTPAGTPTSEEEVEAPNSLEALVPAELWADCQMQAVPEENALQSAVCLPKSPEAPDRWEISLYPDGRTVHAAYEEERDLHGVESDSGSCSPTFWGGEGPWLHGPDRPGGRRLCYLDGDDAVIVWTHERLGQPTHKDVLVTARKGGIDHAGLWRWFRPWHHEIGKVG